MFFDGECALCNKTVQFILRHEKTHDIVFCRLNSNFANNVIPDYLKEVDSVILLKNNKFYTHFDVITEIIPQLKWYCKIFYAIKILPKNFRKKLYNIIASNRKRWFGSVTECWLLQSKWKERLVE